MEKAKLLGKGTLRFFDIAANLTDSQFRGEYYDKRTHAEDVDRVIARAASVGCEHLLIVGGYLAESSHAFEIASRSENFWCTVGVHPCRVDDVDKNGGEQEYFEGLARLIEKFGSKCVAIGECGLDYDRFDYTPKELQLKYFPPHFDLAERFRLPMYLHNRNTGNDFFEIVRENRARFSTGVVHSFTGTEQELEQILALDLFVGVNGCSLKTPQNIEVVKKIPLERLMIETDAPYCEIRNTHAGASFVRTKFEQAKKEKWNAEKMVKGRNEPCQIVQVLEVLAKVLAIDE